MKQLKWNELDFLECLEVEPVVEEYAVSHGYTVIKDGLRLLLTVWQLESLVAVSVFREGTSAELFHFAAFVRGEARHVNDKRGTFLQLEDCIVAPNRFWYIEAGDPCDRQLFPIGVTIEIGVKPDIRVAIVRYVNRT